MRVALALAAILFVLPAQAGFGEEQSFRLAVHALSAKLGCRVARVMSNPEDDLRIVVLADCQDGEGPFGIIFIKQDGDEEWSMVESLLFPRKVVGI